MVLGGQATRRSAASPAGVVRGPAAGRLRGIGGPSSRGGTLSQTEPAGIRYGIGRAGQSR
jgi:hypothetical protein